MLNIMYDLCFPMVYQSALSCAKGCDTIGFGFSMLFEASIISLCQNCLGSAKRKREKGRLIEIGINFDGSLYDLICFVMGRIRIWREIDGQSGCV